MTANLARVQAYLGDHVGREVNFISISVDPATDTPAELKKYAARFKAKPGWYFLTGSKENLDKVLHKLGGYVADKGDHSTRLIIGNESTGEWVKVFAMSKADEIANIILKMIEPVKE
jgi:cytochrome oxidase Cu insertion factor (SCO1/SenC/PrrC family)